LVGLPGHTKAFGRRCEVLKTPNGSSTPVCCRQSGWWPRRSRRLRFSCAIRSTVVSRYLIATTALFFGLGIVGAFVTLGVEDSIGGRIISGAMTVAFVYFGVRRLRLLRSE
jgi:hypothetical protein